MLDGQQAAAVQVRPLRFSSSALRAEAVEFELVVELGEAAGFFDVAFEGFDGAGDVEALDAAAFGADKVVVVVAFLDDRVVSTAVVQAESADDAALFELHEQAKDGGAVSAGFEFFRLGDVGEAEGLVGTDEDLQHVFESAGAAQAAFASFRQCGLQHLLGGLLVVVTTGGGVVVVEHGAGKAIYDEKRRPGKVSHEEHILIAQWLAAAIKVAQP